MSGKGDKRRPTLDIASAEASFDRIFGAPKGKYHAEYKNGELVYEVDNGVVTVDKRVYANDAGYYVMPDIQPYQAVANDCATGSNPVIAGRAQHRNFLRRNGYTEVGNEKMSQPKELRGDFSGMRREVAQVMAEVRQRRGE